MSAKIQKYLTRLRVKLLRHLHTGDLRRAAFIQMTLKLYR
jgi:hypothetical protein